MFGSCRFHSEVVNALVNGNAVRSDFVTYHGEDLISVRYYPLRSKNLPTELSDDLLPARRLICGGGWWLGRHGTVRRTRRKVDLEFEAELRKLNWATGANAAIIGDDCKKIRRCRLDLAVEKEGDLVTD